MECGRSQPALLRLDVGRPDHLAPFFGLLNDKPSKVGGRHWRCHVTKFRKLRLHLGVGEGSINLLVELLDDLSGCSFGCADALPSARLIPWYEFAHGRSIRQAL